jgi:phosphoacetylglucosamine mutase
MVAQFIGDLVKKAKMGNEAQGDDGEGEGIDVGVVQTAYANGSSTRYIKGVSAMRLLHSIEADDHDIRGPDSDIY